MLEIIYQDSRLVVINKPSGLLVHRTSIATDVEEFAIQLLRNQIGQKVYPTHRLDRKTSGVLVFALDEATNKSIMRLFAEKQVRKTYLAIVRGFTEDEGTIDYPLKKESGQLQEAVTHYKTLERTEVSVPFGKHDTSRYSLVEVRPETGRMHQIRKHFAHILHPVIGDRPHGCNKQNRLFKEKWNLTKMMLHARSLEFSHPSDGQQLILRAGLHSEFLRILTALNITHPA